MAKNYLSIDTFDGGLVTNSDPANLGQNVSKVMNNFRIDKHGSLITRKRHDHVKTFNSGQIVFIHQFVDVTNNDNKVWFAIDNAKKVYMYNESWGNESTITTNPIHTFTGTIDKYDISDDGNVVRIVPGIADDPILIQYISSRQFFYGNKQYWYNSDTANSGWYVDIARPTRTSDLPFRVTDLGNVPDQDHEANDPGSDDIIIWKNKLVGNIPNDGGQYKYKVVPVFDGDQEVPLEFDNNIAQDSNLIFVTERNTTKATIDRKASTFSEEQDMPLGGRFNLVSPTGSTAKLVLNDIEVTTKRKSKDQLGSINITSGGNGYTSAPSVTITGGGGSGATATCTINSGQVNSVTITNAGTGYTSVPTISIANSPGENPNATATGTLSVRGPYVKTNHWNPRITRLNVYRANLTPLDFTTKPSYRLIDSIPIDTTTADKKSVTANIYRMQPHEFILAKKVLKTSRHFAFLYKNYKGEDCEINWLSNYTADPPKNMVHYVESNNDLFRGSDNSSPTGLFKDVDDANRSTEAWLPDIFNGQWECYASGGAGRSDVKDSGSGLYCGNRLMVIRSIDGTDIAPGTNYDGEFDNCVMEYTVSGTVHKEIITDSHLIHNLQHPSGQSAIQNDNLYQEYFMVIRVAGNSFPSKIVNVTGDYTIYKNNLPIHITSTPATITDPTTNGSSNDGKDKISITIYDTGRSQNRTHPFQNENNNITYEVQHIYGNRNWVGDVKITSLEGETEEHQNAIMYSEPGQHDNIPTTNFIKLVDIQGGKIMGIHSIMNNLIVFGENGIFRVNVPKSDPSSYSVKETIPNVKVVSKYGIASSEDSIYFCSDKNIFQLTPNFTLVDVTHPIRDQYRNYSTSDLSDSQLVYDPSERKLLLKIGKQGSVFAMEHERGIPVWHKHSLGNAITFMTMSKDNKKTFIDVRKASDYSAQFDLSSE